MLFTRRIHKRIALLLVMTLLMQSWLLHAGVSHVALATPLEQTPAANHSVYLPLVSAPVGAPDFMINSPTTKKISGTLYFSIQSTNQQPIKEVIFKANNTELGKDTTASDGFKIFVDVKRLPAGTLELSAIATGPGGTTTKKITVEAIPNPPSSATVGSEGAVVASEIGSVIAIPPGGAPTGTTITIDERTQQEVTTDTGFDWEKMSVTFLGAQQISASQPISSPLIVSSAGFGNRVQPGQAVVNYMILPDADGDGVDELEVINSASVAPNGDVISDPTEQLSVSVSTSGMSGKPGSLVNLQGTGFNAASAIGNIGTWTSSSGSTGFTIPILVTPETAANAKQSLWFVIPPLPSGVASLNFHNKSSGMNFGPITISISTTTALTQPGIKILDQYFADVGTYFQTILDSSPEENSALSKSIGKLNKVRQLLSELEAGGLSTEIENTLNKAALLVGGSSPDSASMEETIARLIALGAIFEQEGSPHIESAIISSSNNEAPLSTLSVANSIVIGISIGVTGAAILGGIRAASSINLWNCRKNQALSRVESGENPDYVPTTGMGGVTFAGGEGCGNAWGAAGGAGPDAKAKHDRSVLRQQTTGPIVVKIYPRVGNVPLTPFTGFANDAGYFYIPMIPEGEPFTAIAIDTRTGISQKFLGIGPNRGDSLPMFFDLSEADEPDVIRWDGGGDGETWEDPVNWNKGVVPGPGDHVIIDVPAHITVTHKLSDTVIKSLYSAESLYISGGSFVVTSSIVVSENLIVATNLIISSSLTISNALIVEDGKLELRTGRDLTLANLTLSGGELNNTDTLTVTEGLTWHGGWLSGGGQATIQGTTNLTGDNIQKRISEQRLSLGNTVWGASGINGSYLYGGSGAVITLRSGATFDLQGDCVFSPDGIGALSTFNNQGTFTKSAGDGSTPSYVYFLFNNTGTLNVNVGKLQLAGGGASSGTFKTVAGATLDFAGGDHHLKNGATVSGAGTAAFSGGTSLISGTVSSQALVSGGVARFVTANTLPSLTLSGGELNNNDILTVTGRLNWNGGMLGGGGQTTILGATTLTGDNAQKRISEQRLSLGNTVWEAGGITGSYLYGESGAVIIVRTGATFDLQGDNVLSYANTGAVPVFNNQGTFTKSAGDANTPSYVYFLFNNTGTLNANAGRLQLAGGGVNSATMTISAGVTLDIDNAYENAASGVINGNGTLDLQNATFTNNGTIAPTVTVIN